ncbi:MAG: alkaline phosphatase family protein [Bdellovibrionales bacterium]|nr:alkaline phosphatase family protein [Bdellovibrionales bacterium]
MKIFRLAKAFLIVLLFSSVPVWGSNPVPGLDRVVWIWLEGVSFSEGSSGAFLKSLIRNQPSVRFSGFQAVNPSTQGNAIAMIAGSDLGVKDNELTRFFAPTIVDLLESRGIPWKVYAEDFPGACYLSPGLGNYKRYRVPFLSLDRVQSDRYLCMNILNYSNYQDDLKNGTLARFSVVIPNLKSSGAFGDSLAVDAGLRTLLTPILRNEDLMNRTTFVISTMNPDEGRIESPFAMIFGQRIAEYGKVVKDTVNHYSVLRTLEDGLDLGSLNQEDSKAQPLTGFWK